jgi:hypothetical protein
MWEYRVSWSARPPSWWAVAWTNGTRGRGRAVLAPETRVDTYWIVEGRRDLGVKLRGAQASLEIKVRYEQRDGWELWEKVFFQRWTPLESVRCAALLQVEPTFSADAADPVDGVRRLLARSDLTWREHAVHKTRLQADAHSLLANAAPSIDRNCLAELVEFRLDERPDPAWSLCFESAAPARITHNDTDSEAGLVCGYPEWLSR